MINKKLLSFDRGALRYVGANVAFQWLGMLCNVIFVRAIAQLVGAAFAGSLTSAQLWQNLVLCLATVPMRFDAAYYAAQYPDVAAVCGNDEGALLRHYLDHGIDEGRKPSADGIAGDDELSLTEAQFSSVWSPVAINKLAHYKSLKRKCTDE